ncbi:hypothetical protein GUITHDRAFT_162284 [Guillardia theta CCMP2712]|uniref:Uncharacterized protein n=1 Tax=Guillardia theta (strain CCMP2712) TaxID=905079 RepID=L1JKU1_GUITC|nr:hypothetical protein GUITHDRAFT_162284 [Guillardia theta CCMP2712]EKX48705.1 hypothetical protein GUITHDRAFT_162284 [Guillardia theta CCMP2712]|eukprot:XP_005835685.1 hypothetical protein GUITHDRAFT_162284 [Guillardia theta CCMP2712]
MASMWSAQAFSLSPHVSFSSSSSSSSTVFLSLFPSRARGHTFNLARRRYLSTTRARAIAMKNSNDGALDVDTTIDEVMKDINKYIDKYVFVRDVSADDAAEMRAAALVARRKYRREVSAGSLPQSVGELRTGLLQSVRDILVNQQDLIGPDEWDKLLKGFSQSTAAQRPSVDLDAIKTQLRRLFPNCSEQGMNEVHLAELEFAARRGITLEGATEMYCRGMPESDVLSDILFATASITYKPKDEEVRTSAGHPARLPEIGERWELVTPPVNAGPSAFGIFFDIIAKEHPVEITGFASGSSPALNFGAGKSIVTQVSVCKEGSGRGKELDGTRWEALGGGEISLPIISWMDGRPEYGEIPCSKTLKLKAGETRGVCIHTNNINGLIIRMTKDVALDSDFLDQDFGGNDSDDEVTGLPRGAFAPGEIFAEDSCLALACGFTAASRSFDTPPSSQPVIAAFVGNVKYVREG